MNNLVPVQFDLVDDGKEEERRKLVKETAAAEESLRLLLQTAPAGLGPFRDYGEALAVVPTSAAVAAWQARVKKAADEMLRRQELLQSMAPVLATDDVVVESPAPEVTEQQKKIARLKRDYVRAGIGLGSIFGPN